MHPTARYHRNTVVKLLAALRGAEDFTLAHRLDRETSGVLLARRNRARPTSGIKRQLERRVTVEKRYVAITWGAPKEPAFRVDLPLELDSESSLRVRMRVATGGASPRPLASRCSPRDTEARTYAVVQCDLETGRQHQIRVHLAAVGCPLVGDKLYGPDPELFARGADQSLDRGRPQVARADRHALHAQRLAFDHPITGDRIAVEAPNPSRT